MNRNGFLVLLLVVLATLADLMAGALGSEWRLITKPLLMPLLMLFYVLETGARGMFRRILLTALFFSWLGDVFLLMEKRNGLFFILGLSAFLTTHLLYILYFLRIRSDRDSFFRKRLVMLLAVVAYVIELLFLLWPGLDALKIPVVVYAGVIGTMLCLALWQCGRLEKRTAYLFAAGAALFVLSDSVLSIDRFRVHFTYSGILVMTTYVAAQVLIAMGSIAHLNEEGT
jgi:uncharacterized membrane protein YhhN